MSKFGDVTINGNGNQVGDNNTQNNINVTHKHHHNQSNNNDGGEVFVIGGGILALLATVIWFFFNHIDQVYFYLNIGAITSPLLVVFALAIFLMSGYLDEIDLISAIVSVVACIALMLLAETTRQNISDEVIHLAMQKNIFNFWAGLSEYGKKNVVSHFISALLLSVSIFIAHLFSLRQLSKSAANPNRVGFWYGLYRGLELFEIRSTSIFMSVLVALILVSMFWDKIF